MSRSITDICKRCGETFSYPERSYAKNRKYGFSKYEYCDKCRVDEKTYRESASLPYFDPGPVTAEIDFDLSSLFGSLEHPDGESQSTETPSEFDPKNYGMVPGDVVAIYE